MFTIKHISLTTGGETLYEGTRPTFSTKGSTGSYARGMTEVGEFSYTDAKGEVDTLRGGKVYVMNDAGKTVATYELERPVNMSALSVPDPAVELQNPGLTAA